MTQESTSGPFGGKFLTEEETQTSFEPIPSHGFSELVKVKRQGRWFLLKGLKPEYRKQPVYLELLKKEYALMVQLDHPNIVKAYAKEMNDELGPCIVMEYIDGMTLDRFLDSKPSRQARRKVVDQLIDALAYIHNRQILHRDLKPSNILITHNGNNVKILDFGLSDADDYAILKQSAGTLGFISPEQKQKSASNSNIIIDCKSDIYTFGLLLREIFPHQYRCITVKCTRKNPEQRYADMEEVRKAFERYDFRRRWLPMIVAVAAIVALALLVAQKVDHSTTEIENENYWSADLEKHFKETEWYLEVAYQNIEHAADQGTEYREVLLENMQRTTASMNSLIEEMAVRYNPENEEWMEFKTKVTKRHNIHFQRCMEKVNIHCKSYKEEFRQGNLSQREYDSIEWMLGATLTTMPVGEIATIYAIGSLDAGSMFAKDLETGLCWSPSHNPTLRDYHAICDSEGHVLMEALEPNATYFVRAYMLTPAGVTYGNETSFTTLEGDTSSPDGAAPYRFSVGHDKQVWLSQGNLQYRATTDTWRFAEHPWDIVGEANAKLGVNYDDWIDLFGWGTSGHDHGAVNWQPWSSNKDTKSNMLHYAYGHADANLYDFTGEADWGYNAISNGGNQEREWRTMTVDEWMYLIFSRNTASGYRFAKAKVNKMRGLLLFPDNWKSCTYALNAVNIFKSNFNDNEITLNDWTEKLEPAGAIFLPFAGVRTIEGILMNMTNYYTSSAAVSDAWHVNFSDEGIFFSNTGHRGDGLSVRLVRDVE